MLNLFRAEWTKIGGNRWVVSCLVWVFPLLAIVFVAVSALVMALSDDARAEIANDEILWTEQAVSVWDVPNNQVGRLVLLGFAAVVFAGEYQWQTWKNTVPRNRRPALILVKFVTLGLYIVLAFVLMSLLWALGWGLLAKIAGGSYGPAVTGSVLGDFAGDYALQASLAFSNTLIAAGYAALAAMITRSILGSVLVSFGAVALENVSIVIFLLVGWFLRVPRIVEAYRFTPSYNLSNVAKWISDDAPATIRPYADRSRYSDLLLSDSLGFSLAVLVVWMVGLVALSIYLFRRQDLAT